MKLKDANKKIPKRKNSIFMGRKKALRKADKFGNKVIKRIDDIHR